MLEDNPCFIIKYLDQVYSLDKYISDHYHHIEFEFIWDMDSYVDIIETIIDYILRKDKFIMDNNYLNVFFSVTEKKDNREDIINKQKSFISNFILNNHNDIKLINLIITPIKKYFWNELEGFVLLYLRKNKNVDAFKKLRLEYDIYSGEGTFLPVYNKMLNFWESLKSKLDSIDFIDIRQYVTEKVEHWRYRITNEEKINFIGHIYI